MLHYRLKDIKRENHTANTNIESRNFKNEFHSVVNNTRLDKSDILSSCFYTDIDDMCKHSTLKFVHTVTNYKTSKDKNYQLNMPIFTYQNRGHATPLNDWHNLYFFTTAFSTLFFF